MIYAITMTVTLHDSEGPDEETHDISMILCFACFDTLGVSHPTQTDVQAMELTHGYSTG